MTPIEFKEEKKELQLEFKALKTLFGGLLLEDNSNSIDISYYQRKLKELQRRCK